MRPDHPITYCSRELHSIREAWKLLHSCPSEQHSLDSLAASVGLNRNKLVYGFRCCYGKSVHQLLITIRMEAAKSMLITNDHPVKQIAHLSGYSNPANFITAFKKYTGKTPIQYKKSQLLPGP